MMTMKKLRPPSTYTAFDYDASNPPPMVDQSNPQRGLGPGTAS
jgi:hypothetical protein